jgi:site-specific DNA-methyltransferase (adenine-specific)
MCDNETTPSVACEMGRKYIGLDISPEYCEPAKQRVQRIIETPALFTKQTNKLVFFKFFFV